MPRIWVASQRCYLEYRWLPQTEKHDYRLRGGVGLDPCPGGGELVEDHQDGWAECSYCGARVRVLNLEES